jgi:hypothetical protein
MCTKLVTALSCSAPVTLVLFDTQQLSCNGGINFRELGIHLLLVPQQLPSYARHDAGMLSTNMPYIGTQAPDSYTLIIVIELFAVLSKRPASIVELGLEWYLSVSLASERNSQYTAIP